MKERHCSHCFQCLFSQPRAGFFFPLFPRSHSRCRCVGFPRSPRSHTDVCSRGFTASPPSCNTNGVGETLPCHNPDDLTDELFGFDNVKVHSGITGKKKESVQRHGWSEPNLRHPPVRGCVGCAQYSGSHTGVCSPESFSYRLATNQMIQQISRTGMCQRLSALPVIPPPGSERRWFDAALIQIF